MRANVNENNSNTNDNYDDNVNKTDDTRMEFFLDQALASTIIERNKTSKL